MPKVYSLTDRQTVDIHAPHWSPERDEDERFRERVVIYAQYLQADQDWVNAQIMNSFKLDSDLAQRAARGEKVDIDIDASEATKQRALLFRRMVVEMTDETGNPVPLNDHNVFEGLIGDDAQFIESEILRRARPLIEPLPQHIDEARAKKVDPQVIADGHFRGTGEGRVSRRKA